MIVLTVDQRGSQRGHDLIDALLGEQPGAVRREAAGEVEQGVDGPEALLGGGGVTTTVRDRSFPPAGISQLPIAMRNSAAAADCHSRTCVRADRAGPQGDRARPREGLRRGVQ